MALGDRVWAVAESVEGRGGVEGRAELRRMARAQYRTGHVTEADRERSLADDHKHSVIPAIATSDSRQEPYAGKPHVRFCARGAQ